MNEKINKEEYYNTLRPKIILPEYGRHVQVIAQYLKTIPDKYERTLLAKALIKHMSLIYPPHLRDSKEIQNKLWNHLARITNYELDIDYPCQIIKPDDINVFRKQIPILQKNSIIRKYGTIVEKFAKKIAEIQDENLRYSLLSDLANHLKRIFHFSLKENITNEQIIQEIKELTGLHDLDPNKIIIQDLKNLTTVKKNKNIK